MLLPALILICASVAPEYVVVVGPGVSTGRARKALKTMSAGTSHTVRFRLAAKGETGNVAQDKMGLSGKILRYNADGTIPKDNPFVAKADATRKTAAREPTINTATGEIMED